MPPRVTATNEGAVLAPASLVNTRGAVLVLHPLDMVSVALDQLGECVGSLAEHGQEIADALDELLTRSWH